MRFNTLSAVTAGLLASISFAGSTRATVVTVTPNEVNRIVGSGFAALHFNDVFSVDPSAEQKSLVKTTTANFLSALQAALGPAPDGYTINSATLVIGAPATDAFTAPSQPAHLMLRNWDGADITYNDPDPSDNLTAAPWGAPGGQAGTDFASSAVTNGVVTIDNVMEFRNLASTVQSWIDGNTANFGLYFPTNNGGGDTTANPINIRWQIDAVVPEPASIGVIAMAAGLALPRRRAGR